MGRVEEVGQGSTEDGDEWTEDGYMFTQDMGSMGT
jgi:hypothetical protein